MAHLIRSGVALLVLFCSQCLPVTGAVKAVAEEAPGLKLLFLGDSGSHRPSTRFRLLQPVMSERGIELTYTEDVDQLNRETLDQYDGLVVYANIDTITADQANALLSYVAAGKGFVPLHCATYCFRNDHRIVELMGAQFRQHGTGVMTTQSAGVEHPVVKGYETFSSWDETYVHHLHNETNRTVLEYRVGDMQADGNTREPWTWVRTHGDGRVFYTAWGHDERTWNEPGFHNLVERGIRWACGQGETGVIHNQSRMPKMKKLATDLKPFEYLDVGNKIPNYTANAQWGTQEEPLTKMQKPIPAEESMKHIVTPEGFHVELFADESLMAGKPIAMNWDAQGRLWLCETLDYPNELQEGNRGRDRIRVLADTDGDHRADSSTIFAEDLSIPTAIAFHRGGVIVQNGTETLYMKDTDGDGKADVRKVLISDWTLIDTHGGVSNFRNGLDNWIWAMQGYNNSAPLINGQRQSAFRMGFFRFKLSQDDDPIVEELEFIRSTTNNTWGLGISEEGLIFGSTANRAPSFFMPIANRYYERVRGWAPQGLQMISNDHYFDPITDKIRQVDQHGGYTAGAGHAIYTAREYPEAWWNRTAFVCGPTGKLVGTFEIERDGAGMKSESPINLFASDDEWTAPIMAEVGPDGNVWVLDWYNYIVQHNPTPRGFETGKGQAYETDLRDKKYGRIYRVVPDGRDAAAQSVPAASGQPEQLIALLNSPTMLVRLSAQRLLIERGKADVTGALIKLIEDQSTDKIGLNVAAIHALHTLKGLGQLDAASGEAYSAAVSALSHPSGGVRMNAIKVLPDTAESLQAIQQAKLLNDVDQQVVLAALLKYADCESGDAGPTLAAAIGDQSISSDRWLMDALTSAGATHAGGFLTATLKQSEALPEPSADAVRRVAEHYARSRPTQQSLADLLASMAEAKVDVVDPIINGLSRGWSSELAITLDSSNDDRLRKVFRTASRQTQPLLARLAIAWSNRSLDEEIVPIIESMLERVDDADASTEDRLAVASQLIEFDPEREESVEALLELVGPQSPTALSAGLVDVIASARVEGIGDQLLDVLAAGTPEIRDAVIRVMLGRPSLTAALLDSLESGDLKVSDLSTGQRQRLRSHPTADIRDRAAKLLAAGGMISDSDRSKLIESKKSLTERTGDVAAGKLVFTKNCATCHIFKGEGNVVGPNLNGMSVHPKMELLTHILDPNRSVEANYRLYSVLTADGVVISGLLSAESRTTIEMVDAQGKRHTVLREDIDQLKPSTKSAMPEGFEQSIDDEGLTNLLEYLTQKDQFIPLGLESVANVDSTKGMFYRREDTRERLELDEWGVKVVEGVPFALIDPQGGSKLNVVMLYGPIGNFAPALTRQVSVRCRTAAKTIHILGGVSGWGAQEPGNRGTCMIVRLNYADGTVEDHPLVDGQHFADYINRFEVPQSKFAMRVKSGGQIRYLTVSPKRTEIIESIELVKPRHNSAPVVVAITVELPEQAKH